MSDATIRNVINERQGSGGGTAPALPGPAVAIHGGAGPLGAELLADREGAQRVLLEILQQAASRLEAGIDALTVAIHSVALLEDCELFNAGHGSALCSDGTVQMSAAAMRGCDRAAGAVAGVRTISNPIRAARLVLDSPQVLIIGEDADRLAAERGLAIEPNEAFITGRERARLGLGAEARLADAGAHGTVGAVCLDAAGCLASATSTGGLSSQPPGRVGDSPVFGAGTWSDDHVAVSCTGDGEAFVRAAAASRIAWLAAAGHPLEQAVAEALREVGRLGGRGGLIALDAQGRASLQLTAEAMPRGLWHAGGEPTVALE